VFHHNLKKLSHLPLPNSPKQYLRPWSHGKQNYGQTRRLFGSTPINTVTFAPQRGNSKRNAPYYNIDLAATKAMVLGHINSKLFLSVDDLLNTDDLEINRYEPTQPDRGGALQLDSTRRFGRRFRVGFQFDF